MRPITMRLLPFLLLTACPLNEETFPAKAAEKSCIYIHQCENALTVLGVPDVETCTQKYTSDYEGGPSCTFVPSSARECLASLRETVRTCEPQHYDERACRKAWDCS